MKAVKKKIKLMLIFSMLSLILTGMLFIFFYIKHFIILTKKNSTKKRKERKLDFWKQINQL